MPDENKLNGMWKVGIVGVDDIIKKFCCEREQELGQQVEVSLGSKVGFHVCFLKWEILESIYTFIRIIWERPNEAVGEKGWG